MAGSQPLAPVPILVVDDDPNDIYLIERALRAAPVALDIRIAHDGEEALASLAKYQAGEPRRLPRLILLDIKLPRRSGLEVLEWLKSQPVLRRIPVSMLTSSSQPEDMTRAYDLGANSYLVKPVNLPELEEVLRTCALYWAVHNHCCE